ncbi:family 20 glycosylhydrolase [candidate division KSB1 bacterium]|nr:family 20 glycosylhydrolase [candidate division KSB1 bacterium]
MQIRILLTVIFISFFATILSGNNEMNVLDQLIPLPKEIQPGTGTFKINKTTKIIADQRGKLAAELLASELQNRFGILLSLETTPTVTPSEKNRIYFEWRADLTKEEQHRLEITPNRVTIQAGSLSGFFMAVHTLRQMLPLKGDRITLPSLKIHDWPDFHWRGMLWDVGRHFFTKDEVKKYIQLLSYYKINKLHWHLTEDQGWRIEIKKYPKLTEIGAWRFEQDGTRYGGFYTQDEIREIVQFAQAHGIEIIPEIEMPGHSTAALAAYPEISCTGGPFEVANSWGVFDDVYCAGKEATFTFLENVLDEVLALFPGVYVHIGGDECPKTRWSQCPVCQQRIKANNLRDEAELQSYFIRRIETYLNSKGRRLIGWDEILEGGLAPNATVQVWRDWNYAIEAIRQGHDVIMSPTSHCYFDASPERLTLENVYTFYPVPPELPDSSIKHILGGEFNLWSESILNMEHLDYRVFPRALAMAENLWNGKKKAPYSEFLKRAKNHYPILRAQKVNPGPEGPVYSVQYAITKDAWQVLIEEKQPGLAYHFTLDGSKPMPTSPKILNRQLNFSEAKVLRIQPFQDGSPFGPETGISGGFVAHKARGASVTFMNPANPKYPGTGPNNLTDGIRGSLNFHDGFWQGIEGQDLIATVVLNQMETIERISLGMLHTPNSWIFFPTMVMFEISEDGQNYSLLGTVLNETSYRENKSLIQSFTLKTKPVETRYLRVTARNIMMNPPWHRSAGDLSWLFFDEIIVE